MRRTIIPTAITFAFVFFFSQNLYSAEKIFMPFFELINIHADYQYSTAKLFKYYVDDQKTYTLIIPERTDSLTTSQLSVAKIQEMAKSQGCQYYILGDMNRIGETVIFSISMYKTDDGSLFWNDRLKANSPEDIDPILQKVARALGTPKKAVEDGSIYSVTEYDSKKLKQVRSNNSWGISIGGVNFLSKPFKEKFSGGGGIFWQYDIRQMLYEVNAQIYFLSDNTLGQLSINAYYPFFEESNTPFAGGGLGIGWTTAETEYTESSSYGGSYDYKKNYTGSGLMFFFGGGYVIGRSTNVGARAHLRYFIGAYKMSDDEKSVPHGLILNLELYFGK